MIRVPLWMVAPALALSLALAPLASAQPSTSADPPGGAGSAAVEDIRDIRGPIAIEPSWWERNRAMLVAIVAALAVAAGAAALARRRLRARIPDPRALALAELDRARGAIDGDGAFCDAVSEAIRRYIERRFEIEAPVRTTDELLHALAGDEASPLRAHRGTLAELLAYCDLARFGAFSLAGEEKLAMHAAAVRFVDETWAARETAASAPPAATREGALS